MRTTPHSRSTTWIWESKLNSYSVYAAYQSPLGDRRYPFSSGYKLRVSSEIA